MKYRAFISYSHEEDRVFSTDLQYSLETYAKRWYQVRRIRIFRDETNLTTTPSLWSSIVKALIQSEFFLYLASSKAAESKWVQKEVEWWLKNKEPSKIIIILTEGVIKWSDLTNSFNSSKTNAISKSIIDLFKDEPFYVDISWAKGLNQGEIRYNPRFNDEISSIASTLLSQDKDFLVGYNAKHLKLRKKVIQGSILLLTMLSIGLCLSTLFAYTKMKEAIKAREQAEDISSVLIINYRYISGKFQHVPNMSDKMRNMADKALKDYYKNTNINQETDYDKLRNTAAYYSNLEDKLDDEGDTEAAHLAKKKAQEIAEKLMPGDIEKLTLILKKIEDSVQVDITNTRSNLSYTLLTSAEDYLKEGKKREAKNQLDKIFVIMKVLSNSSLAEFNTTDSYILFKANLYYYRFERDSTYFIKAIDFIKSIGEEGILSSSDFILLNKHQKAMSRALKN